MSSGRHEQKPEATTLARHFLMLQTGLSAKLFFLGVY